MIDQLSLDDRTVVVVGGGGGGIGSAIALACADAGATVVVASVVADDVEHSTAAIEAAGGEAHGRVVDVTDEGAVNELFAWVDDSLGPVHGLVNVVGGTRLDDWNPTEHSPLADFDVVIARNLRYCVATSSAAARSMIEHGVAGSIVNLSSASVVSAAYHAAYGAAKAGVEALTRTMAVEWGRHGIRANTLALGTIETPRAGTTDDDDELAEFAVPLRRRGRPTDVAGPTVFLLSDLAGYISGQTIGVDGAITAKLAIHGENGLPIFYSDPVALARLGAEFS